MYGNNYPFAKGNKNRIGSVFFVVASRYEGEERFCYSGFQHTGLNGPIVLQTNWRLTLVEVHIENGNEIGEFVSPVGIVYIMMNRDFLGIMM